jgi:cytochrome c6
MVQCSGALAPGIDRPLKLRIISLIKLLTFVLLTLTVLTIAFNPPAKAADTANAKVFSANGANVFSANCAACHQSGGNIVRRGKNLRPKALKKYGMDSLDAIVYLVENGKNALACLQKPPQ